MLTIEANENAVATVIGSFPLGQRDTIKVKINDKILQNYIKTIGTDTCMAENNLYSYGNFNNLSDINYVNFVINDDSEVNITPGFGQNFSGCLHCKTDNKEKGLGLCKLTADKSDLTIGQEYIFSCYVLCKTGTTMYFDIQDKLLDISDKDDWEFFTYKFTATKENFDLDVIIPSVGECYIDSIQLFLSSQEIVNNYYDNLRFSIDVLNPCQDTQINNIINYSKPDSEDVYVILYMPPITTVDIQDSILCKLKVFLLQEPKNKFLDNIKYQKIEEVVYLSEPFTISGYLLPPDSDKYQLTVGQI